MSFRRILFLGFPCLLLMIGTVLAMPQQPIPTKQEILSVISELYPVTSGTANKPRIYKPGYEIEKRVTDRLLAIANKSPETRAAVVRTLVELLEDPAHQDAFYYSCVWSGACYVLGQLKAQEAVDVMAHYLDIEHGAFTLSFSGFPAVKGLIQIGEPSVPKLAEVLLTTASDFKVRYLAAFALGEIGGGAAKEVLQSAESTEKDPRVLSEIKLALSVVQRTKTAQ